MSDANDPATIVESRDALEHLRRRGFAALLQALEDPECYARVGCNAGKIDLNALAARLKVTRARAAQMVLDARFAAG